MTLFPIKLFLRDKIILGSIISAAVLNLVMWIYLPLAIKPTKAAVFLHYTVHLGVDFIDSWANIFNLPFLGLIILLINTFLAYFIYYYKYLGRLLMVGAAIIQIFLFIEAYFLAYLNF
jgi:hypothetical protein